VIDYMVMEAIAIKVSNEDVKAEKEARKRQEWESAANKELENFR
jgi:hypothetical protein